MLLALVFPYILKILNNSGMSQLWGMENSRGAEAVFLSWFGPFISSSGYQL